MSAMTLPHRGLRRRAPYYLDAQYLGHATP